MYYLLSSDGQQMIHGTSKAVAQSSLSMSQIRAFSIPLPPLAEQRRIVEAIEQQLTRLEAGVASLRRTQAGLRRYKAAVLKAACEGRLVPQDPSDEPADALLRRILDERRARWEAEQKAKIQAQGRMILDDGWRAKYQEPQGPDTEGLPELPKGWAWATPEQLSSTEKYSLAIGPFGSNLKVDDYRHSGVPLIFVRNIRSSRFHGPDTRYVTQEKAHELHAHRASGGDVLITKMGEPPGDACLYPQGMPDAIITADFIKWTPSLHFHDKNFFVYAINSEILKRQILGITKGVAQLKVSLERFRRIAVPLPPVAEQQRIVAEVERRLSVVAEVEAALAANLKRAERLRQAVLKRAFAGKLVPQDPSDEPASVLLERIRAERANLGVQSLRPRSTVRQERIEGF
jgi:type I restriction enzyme S subunit